MSDLAGRGLRFLRNWVLIKSKFVFHSHNVVVLDMVFSNQEQSIARKLVVRVMGSEESVVCNVEGEDGAHPHALECRPITNDIIQPDCYMYARMYD